MFREERDSLCVLFFFVLFCSHRPRRRADLAAAGRVGRQNPNGARQRRPQRSHLHHHRLARVDSVSHRRPPFPFRFLFVSFSFPFRFLFVSFSFPFRFFLVSFSFLSRFSLVSLSFLSLFFVPRGCADVETRSDWLADRRARDLIMNIVQTRGGPRDNGPPSVESLTGQHSVSIDLTLAPHVNISLSWRRLFFILFLVWLCVCICVCVCSGPLFLFLFYGFCPKMAAAR